MLRRGLLHEARALFDRGLGGSEFEKLFLAEDHRVDVVGSELESVSVSDGVGGAGFHAIAAKDAAGVVDVIDTGKSFGAGDALGCGVFLGFDIDAAGGTSRGAEEASDALLETVFVALENMNAAVAGLEVHGLVGVVFGRGLAPQIAKGDAEPFCQGRDGATNIFQESCHVLPRSLESVLQIQCTKVPAAT